jgi:hypothetical protein
MNEVENHFSGLTAVPRAKSTAVRAATRERAARDRLPIAEHASEQLILTRRHDVQTIARLAFG